MSCLSTVSELFVEPCQKLIPRDMIPLLFSNIQFIATIHYKFLEDLEKLLGPSSSSSSSSSPSPSSSSPPTTPGNGGNGSAWPLHASIGKTFLAMVRFSRSQSDIMKIWMDRDRDRDRLWLIGISFIVIIIAII